MSKSTKGGMSPLAGRADVDLERQKLPHRPAVSVCSSTQSIAPIYIRRQSKTPPPSSTVSGRAYARRVCVCAYTDQIWC